ncbi:MAG: rRNA ((967)-C(5))-methyltransferase [Peptococcaceae bacterium]|jgi:16S rRNA (cytosine967-C5)-methyltransferase|nr:rRNA ((967)-C(5))-methyltransferase [Peptococcaceae bacterium]
MKARELAYRVLLKVEEGGYANLLLDEYLNKYELSSLDRAFVTELVYGTIKYQARLDWFIHQLVKKAGKLETGPRLLLRLAFYQLNHMDRVPPAAVTDEAVKLAKKLFHRGVAGLINGVLRNYLRNPGQVKLPRQEDDPLLYLEVVYSHPRWMVRRWLDRYGLENTIKLCEFNNAPADLWIRTNTLRTTRESLQDRLATEGCEVALSHKVPEGLLLKSAPPLNKLSAFQAGLFTVQDESSMLVAHMLKPKPHQTVLDVCAGPGGKTTHLAQLMEDKGLIVACDVHEHRLNLINENARRLGITIIRTQLQDATKIGEIAKAHYPLILVDAPCSGLGVIRRRPDARWRKKPEDITILASLQKAILESVLKVLAPGGRLIYSTCTIEPEENFGVIEAIKASHPELKSINLKPYLPYEPAGQEKLAQLERGMVQFLPFVDGMDGFFIAGLEKPLPS